MRKTKKIPPKTVKYTEKIGKNLLMRLLGHYQIPKKFLKRFEFADFCDTADFFQNTATTLAATLLE